jgi:hypothetical protein
MLLLVIHRCGLLLGCGQLVSAVKEVPQHSGGLAAGHVGHVDDCCCAAP